MSSNKIKETNSIIQESKRLRRRQEILAQRLAVLYGYEPSSDEGFEIMQCVLDGTDYSETLRAIMERKYRKHLT